MAKLISVNYGEALFNLAKEDGRIDEFLEEVNLLETVLQANPEFSELMNHPDVDREEKAEVLDRVFKGRISDEMLGFLQILNIKGRYSSVREIFTFFKNQVKAEKKIGVAYVTSALLLTQEQKDKIEQKLLETTQFRRMEMHYGVDASLVGGIVIRIGDRVVDSSIRTKLEGLSRQLLKIQL